MSAEADQLLDAPLQFDHVVHADPEAQPRLQCASCAKPVVDSYYHAPGQMLCAGCGAARQAAAAPDRGLRALLRSATFGLGASLVGALVYWAVMEYLNLEIGIVAIAIGFMVGRAVAKGTKGRSARRHRILAVALTWFAVGLAYSPFAFKGMKEGKSEKKAAVGATAPAKGATAPAAATAPATAPAAAPAAATTAAPAPAASAVESPDKKPSGRDLAIGLGALLAIVLALPVMGALSSGAGGILSVLIIGFGLRQAWRVAAASNIEVVGPLPVTSAASA